MVCGLMLTHTLPVLALRLAPSAEPAHHTTVTILPSGGLSARTAYRQLFRCEHLFVVYHEAGDVATSEAAKASEALLSQG